MKTLALFFKAAKKKDTLFSGFKIALVVGTVLNLINQGGNLIQGDFDDIQWVKFFLTYCVPFCVSVYSATVSRLKFEPGSRAVVDVHLQCQMCGLNAQTVNEGGLIGDCPGCQDMTRWKVVGDASAGPDYLP